MRLALAPLLLLLLLRAGPAGADDDATTTLDRVREAASAGPEEVLRLVKQSGLDPWDLVDQLRAAAAWEHARLVAGAIEVPDAVALRAFAGTPPKDDAGRRGAYRTALRAPDSAAARKMMPMFIMMSMNVLPGSTHELR